MGTQKIAIARDPESRKRFLRHLLHDVKAIERMLDEGLIEKGITRIGAEQEFCIVNRFFKPSKNGPNLLEAINDPHFTTELARFNLEINLQPARLTGRCLSDMDKQLEDLLSKAEFHAGKRGESVILTGILPSIDYQSVQIGYMTPRPRYEALAEVLKSLRSDDFELNITGVDELIISHNNILFEACNTSFQCHYQVEPDDFVDLYNWSQAIAGPVLAVCANSPLLIGRQLWAETRIPLFQQSIDTRGKGFHLRERQQRVTFGNRWIRKATDVYKSDIARHTVLFLTDIKDDALDVLERGEIPKLNALNLHNGTVYKWNRPCYGVSKGIPHIRIENRYLPSGPTIPDEISNLAFWSGLMASMPDDYREIWNVMSFDNAKENFHKAAMWGIQSGMVWDKTPITAQKLILDILLPMAERGLRNKKVDEEDIKKYLSVIENRASSYQTGARWSVKSFRKLRQTLDRDEATVALTALMHKRRQTDQPVHEWAIAEPEEIDEIDVKYDIVSNVMTTDLITVAEHDLADLVLNIMEWRNIRHLPVEDQNGRLMGIILKSKLEEYLSNNDESGLATAADVMQANPQTATPDQDIGSAISLMMQKRLSCLPVVENGRLVGIFTDNDAQKILKKLGKNR